MNPTSAGFPWDCPQALRGDSRALQRLAEEGRRGQVWRLTSPSVSESVCTSAATPACVWAEQFTCPPRPPLTSVQGPQAFPFNR